MAGTSMIVRADVRSRWRALALLALVAGTLAGASLGAAAAARRTASAYDRFLQRYGVFDASVGVGDHPRPEEIFGKVAELPQVEGWAIGRVVVGASIDVAGRTLAFPDVFVAGYEEVPDPSPIKVLAGREADPARPDEITVGYAVAERVGLAPGDHMTIRSGETEQEVLVTGTFVMQGSFETLTGSGFPNMVWATPAFFRTVPGLVTDSLMDVALRGGDAAYPAFAAAITDADIPTDGPPTRNATFERDVVAMNRLPLIMLWSGVGALAVTMLAVVIQGLVRESRVAADDLPALRSVGLRRRVFVLAGAAKGAMAGGGAAVIAVLVAAAMSALGPLGIARVAEPDPGVRLDPAAMAVGMAIVLALVAAVGAATAWIAARRAHARAFRSVLVEGASRAGMTPAAVVGVRFAVGSGGAGTAARSATAGAAVAIAAIVSAVVLAASFHHLAGHPELSGYTWDAAVIGMGGTDEMVTALPDDVVEAAWPGMIFGNLIAIDGLVVSGRTDEGPPGPMLEGRPPATADEVAVDQKTLRALGKVVGDTVVIRNHHDGLGQGPSDPGPSATMRITGVTVVPRIPFQESENAGQSVRFTPDGLDRVAEAGYDGVYVRLVPGVDRIRAIDQIRTATADVAWAVLSSKADGASRSVQRLASVPWLLAGALTLVGVTALLHALMATSARRRKDLAVLKTLGFTGPQVRSAVRWQAVVLSVGAAIVAVPAGIAAGRLLWQAFAGAILVVPRPIVSGWVAAVAPCALVLAVLLSLHPARLAARTQPAVTLRDA